MAVWDKTVWEKWLPWWEEGGIGRGGSMLSPTIDMGNGRHISSEDALEGHYQRQYKAVAKRKNQESGVRSQESEIRSQKSKVKSQRSSAEVSVQVTPNLTAAIRVLAPHLAPLTEIAEELVQQTPQNQPTPHFRATLQRALEQTHRQHQAQRVIGVRPKAQAKRQLNGWLIFGVVLGLLAALLLGRWLGQKKQAG